MHLENQINEMFEELFPINRSLTGPGVIQSLKYIKENFIKDAYLKKIKSGTSVFDWKVPPAWSINDAYVKNKYGKKIIDYNQNNLHVVSYSHAIDKIVSEEELLAKIHTLPDHPAWIPYRTSYYTDDWGFCCSKNLTKQKDFVGPFEVYIDSKHDEKGDLYWLEAVKKGSSDKEILISTYCCHPSLANDNLSGMILAVLLFQYLKNLDTNFTYRLLVTPETIGAISFLSQANTECIVGGMVITCVAGPGEHSLKEGFAKNHWINQAAKIALEKQLGSNFKVYPFIPDGSDERQYSSPGFRIVTPSIHKSKYYEYKEYHTSADNLDFVSSSNLISTLKIYEEWIDLIESYCVPDRLNPYCEFQLGKHNLYPSLGGSVKQGALGSFANDTFSHHRKDFSADEFIDALNWIMHLSDGKLNNFQIAEHANLDIDLANWAINQLMNKNLMVKK